MFYSLLASRTWGHHVDHLDSRTTFMVMLMMILAILTFGSHPLVALEALLFSFWSKARIFCPLPLVGYFWFPVVEISLRGCVNPAFHLNLQCPLLHRTAHFITNPRPMSKQVGPAS